MIDRHGERGEGRIGFFVTLAAFAIAVFLAVKVVPVRIDAYKFRDVLRDEARLAVNILDDRELQRRILESAKEMKLPLSAKNLSIQRGKREIVIEAAYEQPIDLALTTYTYSFRAEARSPLF